MELTIDYYSKDGELRKIVAIYDISVNYKSSLNGCVYFDYRTNLPKCVESKIQDFIKENPEYLL